MPAHPCVHTGARVPSAHSRQEGGNGGWPGPPPPAERQPPLDPDHACEIPDRTWVRRGGEERALACLGGLTGRCPRWLSMLLGEDGRGGGMEGGARGRFGAGGVDRRECGWRGWVTAAKEGGAERPACWSGAHWVARLSAKSGGDSRPRGLKQTGHTLREESARGVGNGAADAFLVWALRKKKAGKVEGNAARPNDEYVRTSHEGRGTVTSSWDDPAARWAAAEPRRVFSLRTQRDGHRLTCGITIPDTAGSLLHARLPPHTLRRAPRLPPFCSPHLHTV